MIFDEKLKNCPFCWGEPSNDFALLIARIVGYHPEDKSSAKVAFKAMIQQLSKGVRGMTTKEQAQAALVRVIQGGKMSDYEIKEYAPLLITALESMSGGWQPIEEVAKAYQAKDDHVNIFSDERAEMQATIVELQSHLAEAQREIDRLRKRLEISPDHDYDGIDCRDETIRQLLKNAKD